MFYQADDLFNLGCVQTDILHPERNSSVSLVCCIVAILTSDLFSSELNEVTVSDYFMKLPKPPYLAVREFIELVSSLHVIKKNTMGRCFGVIADIQYADADDATDFR